MRPKTPSTRLPPKTQQRKYATPTKYLGQDGTATDSDAAAHAHAPPRPHGAPDHAPPRRGCKPRPVASPITPPARRVTPRPPRTPPPHSTKRTKHSSPANGTPEAKAALKLVDAAARGGDADLLALSSKFWTDAVECRTPKFLEALRRTDPARWRLVKQHMKQFTAIRGLLLAEVEERRTRTHATWRPRSERSAAYHFAPSPAQ